MITYNMYGEAIVNNEKTEQETKELYNISVGKSIAIFATEYCVGKPFVYGGFNLKNGVDAASLVSLIYEKYGIELPRSSRKIAELGEKVNFAELCEE